mmetsp:Transcript_43450/g.104977  ORF Transcript_43450/g.104977 Transcript_43450/m.104977 type:complete len:150 (+) Transcript_43450:87-536(+)
MFEVAVFEVKQVTHSMTNVIKKTWTGSETPSTTSLSPSQVDNPDATKPFARAKPPPNRKTMSKGSFLAVSQSNIVVVRLLVASSGAPGRLQGFAGVINKMTAMSIPTVASEIILPSSKMLVHPFSVNEEKLISRRKIQSRAKAAKRTET